MALEMVLRRMKIKDATVLALPFTTGQPSQNAPFPSEVAEIALAHVVGSKVEAAYRRGDLFDKRQKLMETWAACCAAPKAGKVVGFGRKAQATS
jgi:hypothetical protein